MDAVRTVGWAKCGQHPRGVCITLRSTESDLSTCGGWFTASRVLCCF